ncbi:MAG TPA: hypothetical protein VL069_10655, partial [Opitutus sp.]|nr:hypothetical protein [Opitutus sp.]
GECRSLEDLAIVAELPGDDKQEIPWQADDLRRGPDGGVSRVHLWFPVDLHAGEKRRFHLVRRSNTLTPPRDLPRAAIDATSDQLRVSTKSGSYVWSSQGELASLPVAGGDWRFDPGGAFPKVLIKFPAEQEQPAAEVLLDQTAGMREVSWSSGPLFAKIRIRLSGAEGVSLEQVYRIPHHGREMVITATIFPGSRAGAVVRENRVLHGKLALPPAKDGRIARIPAGIRYSLRGEHAYGVNMLKSTAPGALLAIPLVIGGPNGTWAEEQDGSVTLRSQGGLQRGQEGEKKTLKAFWTEMRLVPVEARDDRGMWEVYLRHVQPLVAVVEEPAASAEKFHAVIREVAREMKPIGWRQEAGRAYVVGDSERVAKVLKASEAPREQDRERLLRGARGALAKLTENGTRKLQEHEKGRAYGALDPYHVTYTQSAAAALAVLADAPPAVTAVNAVMASAVREAGGRVDDAGYPYIDVFSRNLNMQLGPVLFGLTAGAATGDTDLVRFYRDLATAPPVQAVFGRAQRPYVSGATTRSDQTDYLYQAICDFWLRTTELLANEDLSLHPLAYSRFTDSIDVMADVYHGVAARDEPDAAGQARANFFRGQAHTHRWLGWSCAPFIRLLEDPAEKSAVGLTEAIHYAEVLKGRWKNWPDLTYYILADMLVGKGLERWTKPTLPKSPAGVKAGRMESGIRLSWMPVNQATGYRIYRAERAGGPYRWLNSPYVSSPLPATDDTTFEDAEGSADSVYVITAVDAEGRESAWPDSPDPQRDPVH